PGPGASRELVLGHQLRLARATCRRYEELLAAAEGRPVRPATVPDDVMALAAAAGVTPDPLPVRGDTR
ncbi:MAG TPA: hypothetical protein VFM54_13335, partial [Micromonosporaceae bacterium]|nr:hypothetical protein [Micromonosporaceae bacterium]